MIHECTAIFLYKALIQVKFETLVFGSCGHAITDSCQGTFRLLQDRLQRGMLMRGRHVPTWRCLGRPGSFLIRAIHCETGLAIIRPVLRIPISKVQ